MSEEKKDERTLDEIRDDMYRAAADLRVEIEKIRSMDREMAVRFRLVPENPNSQKVEEGK